MADDSYVYELAGDNPKQENETNLYEIVEDDPSVRYQWLVFFTRSFYFALDGAN